MPGPAQADCDWLKDISLAMQDYPQLKCIMCLHFTEHCCWWKSIPENHGQGKLSGYSGLVTFTNFLPHSETLWSKGDRPPNETHHYLKRNLRQWVTACFRHFNLELWQSMCTCMYKCPSVYLWGALIQIPTENVRLKPLLRHCDSEG